MSAIRQTNQQTIGQTSCLTGCAANLLACRQACMLASKLTSRLAVYGSSRFHVCFVVRSRAPSNACGWPVHALLRRGAREPPEERTTRRARLDLLRRMSEAPQIGIVSAARCDRLIPGSRGDFLTDTGNEGRFYRDPREISRPKIPGSRGENTGIQGRSVPGSKGENTGIEGRFLVENRSEFRYLRTGKA